MESREVIQMPIYCLNTDPNGEGSGTTIDMDDRDDKFEEAARIIVLHQQGSSLLQRKLKLGYNRAGRIVDQLEAADYRTF